MHPCDVLPHLLYRLLAREEGLTMGEMMWSIAAAVMIAAVAVFAGSAISPEWREFVGDPTP